MKRVSRHLLKILMSNFKLRGRARIVKYFAPLLISKEDYFVNSMIGDIPLNLDTTNIQEQFMYYGILGDDVIRFFKKIVTKGDVVIDVGANVGYMSAHLANLVGKGGEVHSFEPVPYLFKRLQNLAETSSRSGYTIKANSFALGDKPGKVEIMVNGKENIGWNTIVPGTMHDSVVSEKYMIEMETFDNYIKKIGMPPSKVSFIKIDVEGAEPLVLLGMKEFFEAGGKPAIICEINPHAAPHIGVKMEDIFSFLCNYGYKVYLLGKKGKISPIEWQNLKKGEDAVFINSRC